MIESPLIETCRAITDVAREAYEQGRQQGLRDMIPAINELREELLDAIDGGDECRGRDSQISEWIRMVDAILTRAKP